MSSTRSSTPGEDIGKCECHATSVILLKVGPQASEIGPSEHGSECGRTYYRRAARGKQSDIRFVCDRIDGGVLLFLSLQ